MAQETRYEPYDRLAPAVIGRELRGKVVMVTGSGHGIGRSIAQSFAEAGVARIILVGRTKAKLEEAANELLTSFKDIEVVVTVADITSKDDVKRVFDPTADSPDVLVNNAGYLSTPANFYDADFDDYWHSFTVNVYGTILFTQSFLRHRRLHVEAAQAAGRPTAPSVVITVNSMGAFLSMPNFSSYGANKLALARWSELISLDVPEDLARFLSIHPGAVESEMGIKSGAIDHIKSGAVTGLSMTNPKLTGDFAVWLASDEAKYMAGRFVSVNTDVDYLLSRKQEIVERGLYRIALLE